MVPQAAVFPRTARLRRRAEFLALKREGARWHMRSFVVIRRVSPTGRARLGVTVSRRVGRAVVRNRVKRMVREVFRTSEHNVATAQDVLVIARTGASKLKYAQVASELGRVFRSSGNA